MCDLRSPPTSARFKRWHASCSITHRVRSLLGCPCSRCWFARPVHRTGHRSGSDTPSSRAAAARPCWPSLYGRHAKLAGGRLSAPEHSAFVAKPRRRDPTPLTRVALGRTRLPCAAMAQPKNRRLPQIREAPWEELRRRATVIFLWLQAGWTALSPAEREEVRGLVGRSRGRPRNLTRTETRRLASLAAKAANEAARQRRT